MHGHDIIVIGGSAGGVEALIKLMRSLPPGLSATFFVVMHIGPRSKSVLPQILQRAAKIPATHPVEGEMIRCGHIYVAPPDQHMLIEKGHIDLSHGPKEHHTRPALDPTFRTAAEMYGGRVVGVLLSGRLRNGTDGMLAIQRCGGVTIIQDPKDALNRDMPENALKKVRADYVLPISQIGPVLAHLAADAPGRRNEKRRYIRSSGTGHAGNIPSLPV